MFPSVKHVDMSWMNTSDDDDESEVKQVNTQSEIIIPKKPVFSFEEPTQTYRDPPQIGSDNEDDNTSYEFRKIKSDVGLISLPSRHSTAFKFKLPKEETIKYDFNETIKPNSEETIKPDSKEKIKPNSKENIKPFFNPISFELKNNGQVDLIPELKQPVKQQKNSEDDSLTETEEKFEINDSEFDEYKDFLFNESDSSDENIVQDSSDSESDISVDSNNEVKTEPTTFSSEEDEIMRFAQNCIPYLNNLPQHIRYLYKKRDEANVTTDLLCVNMEKTERHKFKVDAKEVIQQNHKDMLAKVFESLCVLKNVQHIGDTLVTIPFTRKRIHYNSDNRTKIETKKFKQKVFSKNYNCYPRKPVFVSVCMSIMSVIIYTTWFNNL